MAKLQINFLRGNKLGWIVFGTFLISRIFIWFNPPPNFTEIIYSYMPYAHLWASGVKPYLEQWYEYPPMTIPLFHLPHLIDMQTHGSWLHINYSQAYRGIMLLIDGLVFALIWKTLLYFRTKPQLMFAALIYYCLVTAKANHFLYDTMDLAFAAALVLSVAPGLVSMAHLPRFWQKFSGFQVWLGYWLAVGLKLLNGPLGLPLLVLQRRKWPSSWLSLFITGGLVWGVPLLIYRSSLLVMLVYHQLRGLQVDSMGAIIVRLINSFTQTESVVEIYKNYEMVGPVTDQVLQALTLIFPLALVVFILWVTWQAWQVATSPKLHPGFRLSITLGFVLLLMIVSKVLSRLFVLWHIPLVAMLPLKNWRDQLGFLLPSALAVGVTLTGIPDFPVGVFSTATLVGVVRSVAFIWLFVYWLMWHQKQYANQHN